VVLLGKPAKLSQGKANEEFVETVDDDKSNNNNMQVESKEDAENHAVDDESRSEGVVEENRETGDGKDNNVAENSKAEEQAFDHQEPDVSVLKLTCNY
jgi:hypothetical protein